MLLSETSVVMKHSHKGGHCFCTFEHLVVLKRNQRNIYQGKGLKHEHATRSSMNTLLQVAVSIVEHENLFEANEAGYVLCLCSASCVCVLHTALC